MATPRRTPAARWPSVHFGQKAHHPCEKQDKSPPFQEREERLGWSEQRTRDAVIPSYSPYMESFVKQLTASRVAEPLPTPATELPLVTRFRDPSVPYEDLIQCERDCMRCAYAATLDCDGNCGVCPRQTYCPCVNPAKIRNKSVRLTEIELTVVEPLGRN
jgi:hypothetical protein